jgi:hypothetical protein
MQVYFRCDILAFVFAWPDATLHIITFSHDVAIILANAMLVKLL